MPLSFFFLFFFLSFSWLVLRMAGKPSKHWTIQDGVINPHCQEALTPAGLHRGVSVEPKGRVEQVRGIGGWW